MYSVYAVTKCGWLSKVLRDDASLRMHCRIVVAFKPSELAGFVKHQMVYVNFKSFDAYVCK